MSQDPVDNAELRHDIDSVKRLREQDRLEEEFRRDPDWDLVAEHLIKRETVGDLCYLIWGSGYERTSTQLILERARDVITLAIEQCAREYAEREVGR